MIVDSGRVVSVFYAKPESSFYILKILLDSQKDDPGLLQNKQVSVKGYIPGIKVQVGTWFGFEGKWVQHPKYGRQIEITKAPVMVNGQMHPDQIVKMLIDEGVLAEIAFRLQDLPDLQSLLEDTSRLVEASKFSELECEFIAEKWTKCKARMRMLEALNGVDIPRYKISEIWSTFGDDALKVLAENPWELVKVSGVKFEQMDRMAQKAGLDMTSPDRYKYALVYAIREGKAHGDLYIEGSTSYSEMCKVLREPVEPADFVQYLRSAVADGLVCIENDTGQKEKALYIPWHYKMESDAAEALVRRVSNAVQDRDDLSALKCVGTKTEGAVAAEAPLEEIVQLAVEECSEHEGFELSEMQKQGVINALLHPVSVITGLPGTGKSTSLKILVKVLLWAEIPIALMAPTGIAAKRLSSVTNVPASTIHRALGAKGTTQEDTGSATYAGVVERSAVSGRDEVMGESWEFGGECHHPARVVIIDECSMLDQHMLFRILDGTSESTRLVFVGDAAQLPSVGPGNVLRDIIATKCFPVVSLTQIFRQEEASKIVTSAHQIFSGQVPEADPASDFSMLEVGSEANVRELIRQLAQKLYANARAWEGEDADAPSFQVLSPRHGGDVGVTSLNTILRRDLNPEAPGLHELKIGSGTVREGDRVMIVKNNYDLGVFNGDMGKVHDISIQSKRVVVKIFGDPPQSVVFNLSDARKHLRLAYACTVHKYQGLEVDVVVMPLVNSFGRQLQRNLLYTAITRAKKRVFLVGSRRALAKAVENTNEDERRTLLGYRIQRAFAEQRSDSQNHVSENNSGG